MNDGERRYDSERSMTTRERMTARKRITSGVSVDGRETALDKFRVGLKTSIHGWNSKSVLPDHR
jgi:hypothetical protein